MNYKVLIAILLLFSIAACNKNNKAIESSEQYSFDALKHKENLNIDSLYKKSYLLPDDTIKVNQLIVIFRLSIRNRPIRTDVLDEAQNLSTKLNYETGIANCLSIKGVNARYNHEYIKSVRLHKDALTHYRNSWDQYSISKNYNNLGVAYRRLGMEDEAIKYYIESLKISEKIGFTKSTAIALNGIGNAYVTLKKYDEAITYFKLALSREKLYNSERGMAYDYSNLGEAYMYKEQYDTAFYYHIKSLEIANKLNIANDKAIIYSAIGLLFQHKGDQKKALEYYLEAIPTLKNNRSKRLLSFTLINTGVIYKQLKEYRDAENYILSGLNLSKSIGSKENCVIAYEAYSELLEAKGKFREAIDNYKLMTVYNDSIFNIKSENNAIAMNIKYDSEKKDEKISRLKLESSVKEGRIVILFLIAGILSIFIVFFINYNRVKSKNTDLELNNMRHQINNYLDQISTYQENDYPSKKEVLVDDLSEYGISKREFEVLKYISQGLKNKEIAEAMFVSLSTIKTHTKNIFEKLDVRNRTEAAKKAGVL